MTTMTLGGRSTVAAPVVRGVCVACRLVQPIGELEIFPSPKGPLVRCADEDGCRRRYTPRRLAHSTRWPLPERGRSA